MVSGRLYAFASCVVTVGVLLNAFFTRVQFYPTVVHLTNSKTCLLVLGNMAFVLVWSFGRLIAWVLLGKLRDAEIERLNERVRYAVTETCLALTLFREEISAKIVVMFTALFFAKIFHWLAQDRIDFLEQTPITSLFAHVRLCALMLWLWLIDAVFCYMCFISLIENGPTMMLLFGFEFTILSTTIAAIMIKYLFTLYDHYHGGWEDKGPWIFYLELWKDLLHLLVYIAFFSILMAFYGLPFHIMRDIWLTYKSFVKRWNDMVQYREATANMNERYPDATAAELAALTPQCSVCLEDMTSAKKLPCGHFMHLNCLRDWLGQQQICPICRTSVLATPTGLAANPAAVPVPAPVAPAAPVPPAAPPATPVQPTQPPAGPVWQATPVGAPATPGSPTVQATAMGSPFVPPSEYQLQQARYYQWYLQQQQQQLQMQMLQSQALLQQSLSGVSLPGQSLSGPQSPGQMPQPFQPLSPQLAAQLALQQQQMMAYMYHPLNFSFTPGGSLASSATFPNPTQPPSSSSDSPQSSSSPRPKDS